MAQLCKLTGKNAGTNSERIKRLFCGHLLALFDRATDSALFFRIWNNALLFAFKHLRNLLFGDNLVKLEFHLRIYFATNALRKLPPDKQEYKKNIAELKAYLENGSGVDMATNAELVQFFALPYVRDPHKHPVFKRIMQKEWVRELRTELSLSLQKIAEACSQDNTIANEFLIVLQTSETKSAASRQAKQKAPDAIASLTASDSSSFSASDDERHRRTFCKNHKHIAEIIAQFVDFLETSCNENAISSEMLASFSHRLKMAAEAQKLDGAKAMTARRKVKVCSESGSGSDIPPTPGPVQKAPISSRESPQSLPSPSTVIEKPSVPKRNTAFVKFKKPSLLNNSESMGNLIPNDPPAQHPDKSKSGKQFCHPVDQLQKKNHHQNQLNFGTANSASIHPSRSEKSPQTTRSPVAQFVDEPQPTKQNQQSLASVLNYTKIIHQIVMNPGSRYTALLLQALRQSVVTAILRHNESSHIDTKEELARFLNSIASFRDGRNYLLSVSQGKELLYEISLMLRTKRVSIHVANHLLATLQKLSIRSNAQKELVLCGMVEWALLCLDLSGLNSVELTAAVSTTMSSVVSTSAGSIPTATMMTNTSNSGGFVNFGLEYALSLLPNLLTNPVAQTTTLRYRHQIIAILSHLLTHKPTLTRQICHALYCVMGMYARVRQAARERDLNAILTDRISKAPNFDAYCQLVAVRRLLNGEASFSRQKRVPNEEDTEYEDYLEAEIDSTDTLRPTLADIFGEQLLRRKFNSNQTQPIPELGEEDNAVKTSANTVAPAGSTMASHKRNQRQIPSNGTITKSHKAQSVNAPANFNVGIRKNGTVTRKTAALRTSSVMSHATFVLENDKRKPLMVPCGFEQAVSEVASSSEAAKMAASRSSSLINMHVNLIPEVKKRLSPPEPTPQPANAMRRLSSSIGSRRSMAQKRQTHRAGRPQPAQKRPPWVTVHHPENDSDRNGIDEKENSTECDASATITMDRGAISSASNNDEE